MELTDLVQYFSSFVYGKHSFYIFLSYAICFFALGLLIYFSQTGLKKAKHQLMLKYAREEVQND